jgi:magnesium chelatase subunit I
MVDAVCAGPLLPACLQDQQEMKLALLLNVIDPNIGGVLIMGDRGTAKSVAVSVPPLAAPAVTVQQ